MEGTCLAAEGPGPQQELPRRSQQLLTFRDLAVLRAQAEQDAGPESLLDYYEASECKAPSLLQSSSSKASAAVADDAPDSQDAQQQAHGSELQQAASNSLSGKALLASLSSTEAEPAEPSAAEARPADRIEDIQGTTSVLRLAEAGGEEALNRLMHVLSEAQCRPSLQLNQVNALGNTALACAASRGDTAMLMCLLKHPGVDINILNVQGQTAFACAVGSGCRQTIIRYLVHLVTTHSLQLDHLLSWAGSPSQSPMAVAVNAHSAGPLIHLLSVISISAARAASTQPAQAIQARHQALQGLLERPVDNQGRPPLLAALQLCKLEHAAVLLEHGASICVQEPNRDGSRFQNGRSSLAGATMSPAPAQKAGGLLNAAPGSTPLHLLLHCAARFDSGKAARSDSVSDSPFAQAPRAHAAFSHEHQTVIEPLLHQMLMHPQIRETTAMQDSSGDTWVHVAIRYNLHQVVSLLRGLPYIRAACKHVPNNDGHTPAELALALGHFQCYDELQVTRPKRSQSLHLQSSPSQQPFLMHEDMHSHYSTAHVSVSCLSPNLKALLPSSSLKLATSRPAAHVTAPNIPRDKESVLSTFKRAVNKLRAKLGGKEAGGQPCAIK